MLFLLPLLPLTPPLTYSLSNFSLIKDDYYTYVNIYLKYIKPIESSFIACVYDFRADPSVLDNQLEDSFFTHPFNQLQCFTLFLIN